MPEVELDPFIVALNFLLIWLLTNIWQSNNLDFLIKIIDTVYIVALFFLSILHMFLLNQEEENAWRKRSGWE